MKARKDVRKDRKNPLDRIEEFLEEHIEKNLRKGLTELEKLLAREELKEERPSGKAGPGPLSYLEAFLEDRKVASIAPSTKFLVERVLRRIEPGSARVVIEYGPAEGVLTRELLRRLPQDGVLAAIETNPGFVETLSRIGDPRLRVLHGDVRELDRLLGPLDLPPADAITSGIPFSFLKPLERHQLLHKTEERLSPGGRFVAYQVTAHLLPLLKYHFRAVDVEYEVRNLPPNFIFTGVK